MALLAVEDFGQARCLGLEISWLQENWFRFMVNFWLPKMSFGSERVRISQYSLHGFLDNIQIKKLEVSFGKLWPWKGQVIILNA